MRRSPEEYIHGLEGVNDKYDTEAHLGTYRTSEEQFPNPEGMIHFNGFGMNDADYVRGFCDPNVRELPDYDKLNYTNRYTLPRIPDEDQLNTQSMESDFEFRTKELESKGFLTRPKYPTER